MIEVYNFLKSVNYFYLATMDGDQPRVRPFGTVDLFEGRIYVQTSKDKNVSKQIQINPKIEIFAFDGKRWARIAGKLIRDDRRGPKVHMLETYPFLKFAFDVDDENLEVLYFKDCQVTLGSFEEEPRTLTF